MIDRPRYLTRPEACEYLRIGLDKLSELVAAGKIPVHRIGRRQIFDPEELDAYIHGEEATEAMERR